MIKKAGNSLLLQTVKAIICFELIFSPYLIDVHAQNAGSSDDYSDHDVFGGFENNRIPDLTDPEQKQIFTLYLKQKFLGDTSQVTLGNFDKIVGVLESSPDIKKPAFPSVSVQDVSKIFNVGPELKSFLQDLNKSSGKWRALYLQPLANVGDWLKTKHEGQNILDRESFLRIFPESYMKILEEKEEGKKVDPSQILADLVKRVQQESLTDTVKNLLIAAAIHTFSFDEYMKFRLKQSDAMSVLEALKDLALVRDSLAKRTMNCAFDQILEKSNLYLKYPLLSNENLDKSIESLTKTTEQSVSEVVSFSRLIRPLSLVEAPFRSCLAQDCASQTYFTKGLDPNFIYFTVKNDDGWTGHVTVALGEALYHGEKKKVAFLDKVQGYNLDALSWIFEGVRRSCLKMGYELSVPLKMGDVNGIANEEVTRQHISNMPSFKGQNIVYKKFSPHSHNYEFDEFASRSDDELSVKPLLPLDSINNVKFFVNDPVPATPVDTRNMKSLYEIITASFQLKFGDLNQQKKYFDVMETLLKANLPVDPEFKHFLEKCIKESSTPIAIRYRAMTHLLMYRNKKLDEAFLNFSEEQITILVHNWMQKKAIAQTAINSNVAWRSFASGKIPVQTLLKYQTDFNPSDSLKLLMADPRIIEKAKVAVKSFMSTPLFQHKYVYTYIHQLAIALELAKLSLEQNQDEVVLELEQYIFKTLDGMATFFPNLKGKEKQEFYKLLANLFQDPNSPFDEVVMAKYVKTHYESLSSKTFWFRAKKTYIPTLLFTSFWALSILSYKIFGFSADHLFQATGMGAKAAEYMSIVSHVWTFGGTFFQPLFSSNKVNPYVRKKRNLKEFYMEVSKHLKTANCTIALLPAGSSEEK